MEYNQNLPNDFNPNNYKIINKDLINLNENQLKEHYIKHGYLENRKYKLELPSDFNPNHYKTIYKDLKNLNNEELKEHYIKHGYFENRKYKLELPSDFNPNHYKIIYEDLKNLNNEELKEHYIKHGYFENRIYKFPNNHNDLNLIDFNKINYIDHIVWINLEKSINRFNGMKKLLKNIKIDNTRIEAIDGNNLGLYKIENYIENNNLSNYEIACTLSHIKSINYLNNINGKYFLICEDDISLKNLKYFKINLEDIIVKCPEFDILLIYKTYHNKLDKEYVKWIDFYNNNDHIGGTVAYIMSKKCIDVFCDKYKYNNNIFDLNDEKINVADIFIYKNFNTYVYKYNFFDTLCTNSYIHPDHLESHIINSIKERSLIKNLINI